MEKSLDIKKIETISEWLCEGEIFTHSQSINWLIDQLGKLSVTLAYVNNSMAIAKRILNNKKVDAYLTLVGSSVANEQYFAPSLAKDYISAQCATEAYNYDLCERTSRSIVHTIDAVRTAISALKEDLKTMSYSQQRA